MAIINKLTTLKVNTLSKPGRYGDGAGLWLLIRREGSKSWQLRYMMQGRARYLGLGPLHSVNLAEARNRAREARQLILDGKDPLAVKHEAAAATRIQNIRNITFREAASQFLATDKVEQFRNPKHRAQWHSTLKRLFPKIGDLPLQQIDTAIVLQTLLPIWRKTPETGSRLRGRIERIFAWAKAHKLYDGENPASRDVLQDTLPIKAKAKHHKAMPYGDVPGFMEQLKSRDTMSAMALQFTVLTAMRTNEVIKAKWSEIDFDAGVWTCPKTKNGKPHRVPLSHRAVEILRALPRTAEHVFINGRGRPLSNMTMLELLRGMAGNGYTVHGFRSSFSDWARDRTGYARDVIEMALAHTIKDKSEAAYRRGDALDKRRRLMAEWARYCEEPIGTGATVTAIRAG